MPTFELTRKTILTTTMMIQADSIESIQEVYNNMNHPKHDFFLYKIDDIEMSYWDVDRGDIEIKPAPNRDWCIDLYL